MNWFLKVLKQYADFNGRSRRAEYWIFSVTSMVLTYVTVLLDYTIGLNYGIIPFGIIYTIYSLGLFVPTLAVTVRRLHDVGKSGWMFLISLVPVVGTIWLLVLLAIDSDCKENQYGPNPKATNVPIKTYKNENAILFIIAYIIFVTFLYRLLYLFDFFQIESIFKDIFRNLIGPIIDIVWNLVSLILALMIKDKKKQIIAFIMGTIILYYHICTRVYELIQPEEFSYFQF